MKLRKRFAAMCAAAVMALGTLGIEASAWGTVSKDYASSTSTQVSFDYSNVDGYDQNAGLNDCGEHQGQKASTTFTANFAGNHSVSFSPTYSSSAYIFFYEMGSNIILTIPVPKYAPGMPSTLTTTVNLSTTGYKPKVISRTSATVNGFFTVYGVH